MVENWSGVVFEKYLGRGRHATDFLEVQAHVLLVVLGFLGPSLGQKSNSSPSH